MERKWFILRKLLTVLNNKISINNIGYSNKQMLFDLKKRFICLAFFLEQLPIHNIELMCEFLTCLTHHVILLELLRLSSLEV